MKTALSDALREIITALDFPETDILVQLPKNPKHGDFATNLALKLAGMTGNKPQEIAQSIARKLQEDYPTLVDSASIAGPGFINISINKEQIVSQLRKVLEEKSDFGRNKTGEGKKALVEFVSANPTGPLTVGHGRGAI